jgi:uncharacterized membrane protein
MFMGLHWLWWLFLVLTGVALVWALWRTLADENSERRSTNRSVGAEEALRARYASGEIDEEEFARRLDVLRNS